MKNIFGLVVVGIVFQTFTTAIDLHAQPPVIKVYEVDERNNEVRLYDRVDNQHSEAIIENLEHIRLECHAYYPVQWIYTGNGIPVLSTDISLSTTQDKRETQKQYIASAFVSPIEEHHTGSYICSRTEYLTLTPYVYIYVTGPALFTSSQGKTIHIPRNDSNILIPCSVSHPKIQVSLQLLDGGGRKKAISKSDDIYVYDPRKGFRVNLNKIEVPEGTYVCVARYNKVVKRVDYGVTSDVTLNSENSSREPQNLLEFKQRPTETCVGESCDNRCETHTDCPSMMNCYTDHSCRDPCIHSIRCGKSSLCRVVDFVPECYCPPGFVGDATKECFNR